VPLRAVSLGLVAALGFLLLVSLVISAALTAFGNQLNAILPFGKLILSAANLVLSLGLISILFAAIYKSAARGGSTISVGAISGISA
jgi:membrane protein